MKKGVLAALALGTVCCLPSSSIEAHGGRGLYALTLIQAKHKKDLHNALSGPIEPLDEPPNGLPRDVLENLPEYKAWSRYIRGPLGTGLQDDDLDNLVMDKIRSLSPDGITESELAEIRLYLRNHIKDKIASEHEKDKVIGLAIALITATSFAFAGYVAYKNDTEK